jgi:hypothetical protein
MTDRQHSTVKAELVGMFTSNTTQGAFTNGSFTYTEPEMRALIANWLDLARSYGKSIDEAHSVTLVKGPGHDFASQLFARAANDSGTSYISYLDRNRAYCLQQAQLFQDSLNAYLGVEHTNITELSEAGPIGSDHGV